MAFATANVIGDDEHANLMMPGQTPTKFDLFTFQLTHQTTCEPRS
jgi:hypothetical protein